MNNVLAQLPLGYTVVLAAFAAVFGAVFGSFINCLAWRVVSGESVLNGRSHCTTCGHTLSASDLIPLVSWLALRGKCRYCGSSVSARYFIVECIGAVGFVALFLHFGISLAWVFACALFCVLLALSLVDLDTYIIPNGFIIAGIIIWVLYAAVLFVQDSSSALAYVKDGLLGGAVVGGGLLIFSLLFDALIGRKSLGGGDIKLFFVVGLFLGLFPSLLNLLFACIIGIVFSLIPRKGSKEASGPAALDTVARASSSGAHVAGAVNASAVGAGAVNATEGAGKTTAVSRPIPFGPAISLATLITMLWGTGLVTWYLSLL